MNRPTTTIISIILSLMMTVSTTPEVCAAGGVKTIDDRLQTIDQSVSDETNLVFGKSLLSLVCSLSSQVSGLKPERHEATSFARSSSPVADTTCATIAATVAPGATTDDFHRTITITDRLSVTMSDAQIDGLSLYIQAQRAVMDPRSVVSKPQLRSQSVAGITHIDSEDVDRKPFALADATIIDVDRATGMTVYPYSGMTIIEEDRSADDVMVAYPLETAWEPIIVVRGRYQGKRVIVMAYEIASVVRWLTSGVVTIDECHYFIPRDDYPKNKMILPKKMDVITHAGHGWQEEFLVLVTRSGCGTRALRDTDCEMFPWGSVQTEQDARDRYAVISEASVHDALKQVLAEYAQQNPRELITRAQITNLYARLAQDPLFKEMIRLLNNADQHTIVRALWNGREDDRNREYVGSKYNALLQQALPLFVAPFVSRYAIRHDPAESQEFIDTLGYYYGACATKRTIDRDDAAFVRKLAGYFATQLKQNGRMSMRTFALVEEVVRIFADRKEIARGDTAPILNNYIPQYTDIPFKLLSPVCDLEAYAQNMQWDTSVQDGNLTYYMNAGFAYFVVGLFSVKTNCTEEDVFRYVARCGLEWDLRKTARYAFATGRSAKTILDYATGTPAQSRIFMEQGPVDFERDGSRFQVLVQLTEAAGAGADELWSVGIPLYMPAIMSDYDFYYSIDGTRMNALVRIAKAAHTVNEYDTESVFDVLKKYERNIITSCGSLESWVPLAEALGPDLKECLHFMAALKQAKKGNFFRHTGHELDPSYPGSFAWHAVQVKRLAGADSAYMFKYALPALVSLLHTREDMSGPVLTYCIAIARDLRWRTEETFRYLLPALQGYIASLQDLDPENYPSIGSFMMIMARHLISESKNPRGDTEGEFGRSSENDVDAVEQFCKALARVQPLIEKYGLAWVVAIVRKYRNPTDIIRDVVPAIHPFVRSAEDVDVQSRTSLLAQAIGTYDAVGPRSFKAVFAPEHTLAVSGNDFNKDHAGSAAQYLAECTLTITNRRVLESALLSLSRFMTSKNDLNMSDPASIASGIRAIDAVPFRNASLAHPVVVAVCTHATTTPDLFAIADALQYWVDYEDALQALMRCEIDTLLQHEELCALMTDIILSRTSSYVVAITGLHELRSTYTQQKAGIGTFLGNRAVDLDVRMRVLSAYNEMMSELKIVSAWAKGDGTVAGKVKALIPVVLAQCQARVAEIQALPPERLTKARKIADQISRARDTIREGFIACYLGRPFEAQDKLLIENELVRENILRVTALVTSLQGRDDARSRDVSDAETAKALFAAYVRRLFSLFDATQENSIRDALDQSNAWLRSLSYDELERICGRENDRTQERKKAAVVDNVSIVKTLCAARYDERLFTDGISLTVPVYAKDKLTEDDIKEQIRSAAYELVETAIAQGIRTLGDRALTFDIVTKLDSFEAAKEFIAQCEATGQLPSTVVERMQAIRETIKAYASQKVSDRVTETRFRVLIKKDFFTEARAGAGVPGCYDPDGGCYRKMPYFHASEMNVGFIQVFSMRGKQVANAVVVYTPQGAFVFPGYNASLFKMDVVFAEALKELSTYVPRIYLKTSSAGYTVMSPYATVEHCTLTKPATVFRQQYFDAEGSVDDAGTWTLTGDLSVITEKGLRAKNAFADRRIISDVALRDDMPRIEWQELADYFYLPFIDEEGLSSEQKKKRRQIIARYPFVQHIEKYQGLFTLVGIVKKRITEEGRLTVDDDFYAWLMAAMAERLEVREPEVFVDIVDLIIDFLEAQKWPMVVMTNADTGRDEPVRAVPAKEYVTISVRGKGETRVSLEFTRPEDAERLAPELYELQKTEYEPAQWHSVDMFCESLEDPASVNMLLRNEAGMLIGFLIGRPFAEAKKSEGLDASVLGEYEEAAAYYVDDNLIHPDYRGSFVLLKTSLERYYTRLRDTGYAVVFDHARVKYSVSSFYKRLGAQCLAVYEQWDSMDEPFELLRLPLDFNEHTPEKKVLRSA